MVCGITEGKAAMRSGLGDFNKAAKAAYSDMSANERDEIRQQTSATYTEKLTEKGIKREAKKLFKKLESLVRVYCLLESI